MSSRGAPDHRIKAVLCGDVHVGKSSLLSRYIHAKFDSANSNTVGVEFGTRYLTVGGAGVRVDVWDTAGQERFRRAITKHYYRDADIAILVYDTTRKDTLAVLNEWVQEIRNGCVWGCASRLLFLFLYYLLLGENINV
jgi:small GTP-binding protein